MAPIPAGHLLLSHRLGELLTAWTLGSLAETAEAERKPFEVRKLTGLSGDQVGDLFDLGASLGKGCFGHVYAAVVKETGEEQALKFVPKRAFLSTVQEKLIALRHKHVVRLLHFLEDAEHVYCAMDILRGPELYSVLRDRAPLPVDTGVPWIGQMLSGIAYVHECGLVHRDIKPENFMFDTPEMETLKLVDFGLSVDDDDDARLCEVVGSLGYCAPEVFMGQTGPASDVFSAGVIASIVLSAAWPAPMRPESWAQSEQADEGEALKKYRRAVLAMETADVELWAADALPCECRRPVSSMLEPSAPLRAKAGEAHRGLTRTTSLSSRTWSGALLSFASGDLEGRASDPGGCMAGLSRAAGRARA